MPRRVKDEERVEMIIRGLLKQPDNRRCINCNSLGPQYVCTTFWTFVCTNCSGVHREFTHRVKSVSMAKFNEEEIMALQAGGNERAKQIYLKTWDPQRNSYPDSSNLQKLREFVNHVYVDRRYSGENNSNKLSMVKLDSRKNSCEWPLERSSLGRREDILERPSLERASNSGRDDFYGHSSFDKSTPSNKKKVLNLKDFLEERSPRHNQESGGSSSLRNRPAARFEIVDDRFREDGSVKRYESYSKKESRGGSMSPSSQRSRAMTILPAIRTVKAILGEKVPELRIEGPPGANNDGKDDESSARVEKAADATVTGNKKQYTTENSSSLIDFFDGETEPTSNAAESQAEIMASDANDKSSSSVASSLNQVAANAPNVDSVESLLFESANMKNKQEIEMHQLPSSQQSQAFLSHPGNNSSNAQHSPASVESSSNQQQWNKSPASNDPRPVQSVPLEQSSQGVNPGEGSIPGARKEIPEDLFTTNFASFNPAVAGWQMHPPHGTGYGMQFHPSAMPAAAFPNPQKPRNPFDTGDDRFQVQPAMFPSMSSLQGALPNMPTSTALESQPSPYAAALSSQSHVSPYGMNTHLVPGAYMGQLSNNMPLARPQENDANFGRREDAFASLNPIQQTSGTDSLPAAPTSPLPRQGNPFG